MLINYRIAADLFDAKLAISIMSFAYRYSNIKERKPLKSQDRLDTVAHFDIDEIITNIKKMMDKDSNAKRAYWHEQRNDVISKLESLETNFVCPKCDKVKDPSSFIIQQRAIKNPVYASNRCKSCKSIEDKHRHVNKDGYVHKITSTQWSLREAEQAKLRKDAIRSRFRLWCKTGVFK